MLTTLEYAAIIGVGTFGYWIYHARRWPKIGCPKCGGSGRFSSESLVLGHPVQRPPLSEMQRQCLAPSEVVR